MNNEITNELSSFRVDKLMKLSAGQVADLIWQGLARRSSQGIVDSMAGLGDAHDWVHMMWCEAVQAAANTGSIVFGERHEVCLSNAEPMHYEDVVEQIADRVATALLVLHGIKG